MVEATLESINKEIRKYQSLAQMDGDIRLIKSENTDPTKLISDELLFEEENIHLYLIVNIPVKKVYCIVYITEINPEFVETLISRVGLHTTEENIQNYQRDPTLIEKFWNDSFIEKYNELIKYLRKSKMVYHFKEKFKPSFNKNRNNEIVDNYG